MRDWKPKKRKNKNMKKLFLIIVALFALQMQAQTYTEWSTTNALPTEAGTYRLTTDVTLSAAWVVPGETVLDLNDHIVKLVKEGDTDHVISIGKDRTLTIEDKAATKTTRYWEEHETFHYWRNPSTTENGFGLTTVGGCITGGTGKSESPEQWGGNSPLGGPLGDASTETCFVGGGIFNVGKLIFSGGNVVGNVCEGFSVSPLGGGIFNAGDLHIGENANVIGNALAQTDASTTACIWGGGVFHAYSAQSFVNEGSISYNYIYSLSTAGTDGAEGVGVSAVSSFTNHGHITYNRGECPNSTIGGVGVYITTHPNANDIVFVNDGSISNNSCIGTRAFGGGVYIINKEGHGKVSFTNSGKISYNSLNAEGTKTSHGAGVDLMGFATDVSAVTMINEGEISHNTIHCAGSQAQGGGIYTAHSTITNTVNGVITDNQVFNTSASSVGGGVALNTGYNVFYNYGKITRNKAEYAGGLMVAGNSTLVNYGEISGNMASSHGAGIGTVTNGSCQLLSGTRITGNVCRGTAGEGDDYYGVLSKTLAGYGGGIYHAGKEFTIDGGTTGDGIVITGNTALNGGGAMYINDKVVDIKGKVNISENTLTGTDATPSNVLLYTAENTCKLNVNGTLDTTTPIGVGIRKTNTTDTGFTPTCGVVTTGYGTNVSTTELQHFKQDEELYEGTLFDIYKNSDHEVEIGLPVVDEYIDNTERLAKYNGEPISVKIGRTIFGDGCYSTIGLPFDVDETMLKKRFGGDVELMEMTGSTITDRELDVTINFTRATSIEAGKPYLIKVSAATGDVKDPTFTGVVIKKDVHSYETDYVSFIPVFSQTYLENDNQKILFLTGNNTLMWPDSHAYTANFRGLRCYFMLKGVANNARTFNLLFDNETTGIQTIAKNVATGNEYFNLSGQRVSMPQKGVYIKNGKKVIVK